jgi:DNA-binding transcriptional MocR family regulator
MISNFFVPLPSSVYLVPTAQNPTGVTMSTRRKEDIYRVCQEENILVVEDDAYYYLYHGEQDIQKVNEVLQLSKSDPHHMTDFVNSLPGLKNLPPSMLSMDNDGRVLRFDSLSKFISPGFRIGWITNNDPAFVDKYQLLQEVSTQFPSGLSQSVLLAMTQAWGDSKLHAHLQQVRMR